MNDNSDEYQSGAALLASWKCTTREQKLEQACKALMQEIENLHCVHKKQSLIANLTNPNIFCGCADAYRMGCEAIQ